MSVERTQPEGYLLDVELTPDEAYLFARGRLSHQRCARFWAGTEDVPVRDIAFPAQCLSPIRRNIDTVMARDLPATYQYRLPVRREHQSLYAEFVYCAFADPHTDSRYSGLVFVNLVLRGCHDFGMAYGSDRWTACALRPGQLFAFDPTRIHWATRDEESDTPLVLLQWMVPARSWVKHTAALVRQIRGDES